MNSAAKVIRELFVDKFTTYAVLDGAQVPELPQRIFASNLQSACLYRGEIPHDLAQVAPYLVALKHNDEFTQWIVEKGWGNAWGIFAHADASFSLKDIRKHFRTFLKVEFPDGKPRYFRYYDPRVLRDFLPSCDSDQLAIIFGPVSSYVAEAEQTNVSLHFTKRNGTLITKEIPLA